VLRLEASSNPSDFPHTFFPLLLANSGTLQINMEKQSVQVFGRKKTATAVAFCTKGRGLIKVNGVPIELLEPGEVE
jgi:hypothetical protein